MLAKILFFGLVVAILLGALGLGITSYINLQNRYETTLGNAHNYSLQISALEANNQQLNNDISSLQNDTAHLQTSLSQKQSEYDSLQTSLNNCQATNLQNAAQNIFNTQAINQLKANVLFEGGNATVYFTLSDGSQWTYTYDVQALNYYVVEGNYNRRIIALYRQGYSTNALTPFFSQERMNRFTYKGQMDPVILLQASGGTIDMDNYMAFEDIQSVSNFASFIRQHSSSDQDFIRNVLYVKSQMNDYTYNIVGEPRYPLETFLEGGGDCGASTLFVGSVIKAAHPDWKVQFVAVNTNSLSSQSSSINHAILYIDNNNGLQMSVETTAKDADTAMSYYNRQNVYGYHFDF